MHESKLSQCGREISLRNKGLRGLACSEIGDQREVATRGLETGVVEESRCGYGMRKSTERLDCGETPVEAQFDKCTLLEAGRRVIGLVAHAGPGRRVGT